MKKKNVIIIGAAGRDFHNFNTYFRGNEAYNVVAFTAAQIPDIDGRKYPAQLAGDFYPEGIPIHAEQDLERLIGELLPILDNLNRAIEQAEKANPDDAIIKGIHLIERHVFDILKNILTANE